MVSTLISSQPPAEATPATAAHTRFGRMLWLGTLLANLIMIAGTVLVLWSSHQDATRQARLMTENYAKILEENLTGFFKRVDGVLLNTVAELERQLAQGIRLVDETGVIRYTQTDLAGKPQPYVGDRPYFLKVRDNPDAGLVISKPIASRVNGTAVVTLVRRLNYPDGRFAGEIHAAIPTAYFVERFARLDLGAYGNSGFWDQDSLIARYSKEDPEGAKTGAKTPSPQLRQLLTAQVRESCFKEGYGGVGLRQGDPHPPREGDPHFVLVGLADADYLAEWRNNLARALLILLLFTLATLYFSYLAQRGWQQQLRAQQQLRQVNQELEWRRQEAEVAHQQSELILDSAGDGICGVDQDGNLVFINRAAQAMFGWEDGEGIGQSLHLLTHSRYRDGSVYPEAACPVGQTLQDGQVRQSSDEYFWHKDGTTFPVEFTVAPQRQGTRVAGAVILFRDISERRRTEAELEQYRRNLEQLVEARSQALLETEQRASHILASSASGLYGIDSGGYITFINPAACQMLGVQEAAVLGKKAHALFHHHRADGSDYPDSDCPSYGALQRGQQVRVDNEVYWHADGRPIPVMYATHPMERDGIVVGAVTSFIDVSEQRAAAEAREKALLAAEQLVRTRSEFLANMSHEIRTPLNGILGFADLGARHCETTEEIGNAFDKIRLSGQRLLGIINDILDFSKIEAGKLSIEQTSVYLPEVIYHATELVSAQARAKGLALEVELAPGLADYCQGDPLRIGQVLINLLSNAVKFTPQGRVQLRVWTQGERLCFRVTDSGIGMREEQLAQLFTPFQQGDASASRHFGGTGLGLAISKRLLELMQGEISASSQPGQGSCFEFSLPYLPLTDAPCAEAAKPALQLTGTQSLRGLRILVAEDDPLNQAVLAENLLEEAAELTLTANGNQAVNAVRAAGVGHFDLVLMDIQMPEMDGYEAARQILVLDPTLPILAQTAHAFTEERERCLAAGMLAHITKPIDPENLFASILQYARPRP